MVPAFLYLNHTTTITSSDDDDDYIKSTHTGQPELFMPGEVNDLIRDLGLSKKSAQILGS